jgi:Uncharacterized protein conserved in bacteria (DUF2184)
MRILNSMSGEMVQEVLGQDGKPIFLTKAETERAHFWEGMIKNSLGAEINITTLTTIVRAVSQQKFYDVPFAQYVPVNVGEGAYSTQLTTWRSFVLGDSFETGIIDTGSNNTRLAQGDAGVDAQNLKVLNWAKEIAWNVIELQYAQKTGSWDLITAKEVSRKTNWDLGIQRIAFLGANGENGASGNCQGLLNQSSTVYDTTLLGAGNTITGLATTPQNLSNFITNLLTRYRNQNNGSAWGTHLIVPESDFLGFGTATSAQFPLKPIIEYMLESFKLMTGNPNFKILPLRYAMAANNTIGGASGTNVYTMLNYDEKSIRMNLPVDYTPTMAQSLNGFQYQNVGFGQFTGVQVLRPQELFQFTA